MPKIKVDSALYKRVKDAAEAAGYSSPEEFVNHIIEKELEKCAPINQDNENDEKVADQLRGLGYIE